MKSPVTAREVEEVEAALWPFGTPHRRSHESHEQVQRLAELLHAARAAAAPDSGHRDESQEIADDFIECLAMNEVEVIDQQRVYIAIQEHIAALTSTAALLAVQPGGGR